MGGAGSNLHRCKQACMHGMGGRWVVCGRWKEQGRGRGVGRGVLRGRGRARGFKGLGEVGAGLRSQLALVCMCTVWATGGHRVYGMLCVARAVSAAVCDPCSRLI